MAMFPCAVGLHRYGGAQSSAYLGIVNGAQSARSKLRLCPTHYKAIRDFCETNLELAAIGEINQIDDRANPKFCCSQYSVDQHHTLYANLYVRGDDPRSYWGLACDDHAAAFAQVGQIEV
jgi:hypothetical protein